MAQRTLAILLILVTVPILGPEAGAQQTEKPLTQAQVQAMVRDGLADGIAAQAIKQRGLDFAQRMWRLPRDENPHRNPSVGRPVHRRADGYLCTAHC